nr:MAG TPA: hypothetical protein [Caudoviricetes sp.]
MSYQKNINSYFYNYSNVCSIKNRRGSYLATSLFCNPFNQQHTNQQIFKKGYIR